MFRSRTKDEKAPTEKVTADLSPKQPRDPQAPKGRPTPKRSEAQSQRRRAQSTTLDRKEAAKRQREARRADLARQREALASGDERYLPVRDKGPVRRFVRDFVDSRFAIAEFFLPMAVVILVLSLFGNTNRSLQNISLLLWLGVIILIVIDSIGISIRLRKQLNERFPNEPKRGAVAYGLMRTLQMRRLRLPKPQVKRGERP
ncbi:DUF3043 domain-containing protein [Streptomyces sp.]|uniref:DUF3043 domain-containing protein n=1 Tax=Streptomyces sp. TaxID=1931 RepID=UPI002810BAD1|nr:DUF3043 domain-containing protein [Streptomyces sp.]